MNQMPHVASATPAVVDFVGRPQKPHRRQEAFDQGSTGSSLQPAYVGTAFTKCISSEPALVGPRLW